MSISSRAALLVCAATIAATGSAVAVGSAVSVTKACANRKTGVLHLGHCGSADRSVQIGAQGPPGPPGATGAPGSPGLRGAPGPSVAVVGAGSAAVSDKTQTTVASASLPNGGYWVVTAHLTLADNSAVGGSFNCAIRGSQDYLADDVRVTLNPGEVYDAPLTGILAVSATPPRAQVSCIQDPTDDASFTFNASARFTAISVAQTTGGAVPG